MINDKVKNGSSKVEICRRLDWLLLQINNTIVDEKKINYLEEKINSLVQILRNYHSHVMTPVTSPIKLEESIKNTNIRIKNCEEKIKEIKQQRLEIFNHEL